MDSLTVRLAIDVSLYTAVSMPPDVITGAWG